MSTIFDDTTPKESSAGDDSPSEANDVFTAMVARLSRQSVDKHFDAYVDIDWDSPEMAINPEDSRFALWPFDPLAATDWYRSQPPEVRSRVALHRIATAMRTGWEFENVLQRGPDSSTPSGFRTIVQSSATFTTRSPRNPSTL